MANESYVKLLNAIRNAQGDRFTNAVPSADGTVDNLKTIGSVLTSNTTFMNEWLNTLYERIALVRIVTMDGFKNPLAQYKRKLEYGESYVEYATRLVKAKVRDYNYAKEHFMDVELPEHLSAIFHVNCEVHYDTTILPAELKKAFLSYDRFAEFLDAEIDNLYRSMEYDEFLAMKYVVARAILAGDIYTVEIPEVTAANAREIVTRIKGVSNDMQFMNAKYSKANVETYAKREDQHMLVSSKFSAVVDVNVLALAFNMDRTTFMARQIEIDGFGDLDTDRLDVLFSKDPLYETLTDEQLADLDKVPAVLMHRDWFVVLDEMTEIYQITNQMGPYHNYSLHVGRTYCFSPFFKAVAFTVGEQSITSVTVEPDEKTMAGGEIATFKADVAAVNLADPSVVWTIADENGDEVDTFVLDRIDGVTVSVRALSTVEDGEYTLTATSVFDNTKTGTATITVGA